MIIGVEIDDKPEVDLFIKETNDRFKEPNYVKNPFVGGYAMVIKNKDKNLVILNMRPIYFINIPRFIYVWILKAGLNKIGYDGKVKAYNNKQILEILAELLWDKKKLCSV